MNRLMQSASALTLVAGIAAAPLVATAQTQTQTDTGQATEPVVQGTQEAAGATGQAVEQTTDQAGQAAEQAGQAAEQAGQAAEQAGQAAGQAVDQAAQEAGQAAQEAGQAAEQAGQAVEQTTEQAGQAAEGETKKIEATVIEEGQPAEGTAATEQPAGEATVTATTEAPVEEVEGTIVLQDDDSMLTSDLLDAAVYNSMGEKVGDIDDAILSLDGTVEGVVIGVGGFLGIGEKHVAVEMQQISVQTNETGEPQLVIDATRESLEAAPEFVTTEDQQEEAAVQQPAGGMAPMATGTAPATTTAPAEQPAVPTTSN